MDFIRSSRIPRSAVVVECPFLNPEMCGPSSTSSSIKEIICFRTVFSKIFENAGRKSSAHLGWSFFGIGEILAVFQLLGNDDVSIHWLIIWARGDAR
jgi:hypothetical protein